MYVNILPSTDRIAGGIRSALRSIDADMRRAGQRWGREIERGLGDVDVDVDADTTKARKEIDALDRHVSKTRRVKVDADKSAFSAVATAARNVEQNFQALAITAAAMPNTVASVGTALTSLTGVLGLMPAAIGAAGLAFGSLKVATLGFGDAIKNVRDPEKFAESVAQLSPNAQEAARSIEGLMPSIMQLKMTVQDAFFAGFGDQIKQLGSTYLPMFQGVMSQMAASANVSLRSVGDMLKAPAMAGDMSTMTGNMSSAFNILSQALTPVVKAFMDIGVVGSGFLPALADAAKQAASAFAVFIQNARETGELQDWIQTGIDAFKQLMDIAGNLGGIIGGIMKAAPPGGGLLGTIAALTQTLSDFVNSPAGQGAFNTFMVGMQQTMSALMPVLGSFLQAIAPVLGVIGQLAATVITSIAPSFTAWFQAMTPVIQQIAAALQPVLAALPPVLQQVAGVLAGQMIAGIQQLLPVLIPFVQQMGNLMIAVLPLLPPLIQLAISALPAIQQAIAVLLPILTQWANMMTNVANQVVPVLAAVIGGLAGTFVDKWNIIGGAVQRAWTIMSPIFNLIIEGVGRVMDALDRIANNPLARAVIGIAGGPVASALTSPSAASALPVPGLGQPQAGGGANAQRERRGLAPVGPAAPLLPPSAFPTAPLPPVSSYVPPAPSSGSGGGGGGNTPAAYSSAMPTTSGEFSDEALLSWVPSGRYDASGDLAQGLGDCSSAVEDLINVMQGRPTAGRSMSTSNAAEWLTAQGFVPGNMPGAFNVGFDSGHMEATLPGGTNFNWGSDAAAARGGRGGRGADTFPNQYYLPVAGSGSATPAASAAYPPGMPAGTDQQPIYVAPSSKSTGGQQLGQDILSGMGEILGLDGTLFKNPAEFGLMKLFRGVMGLRPADNGTSSNAAAAMDGGGGGLGSLLSSIPQPFGQLGIVPEQNAPGQFMPTMPGSEAAGVVGRAFAPAGAPGPGNQPIDNSIHINNPTGPQQFREGFDAAQSAQYPRMRQPLRHVPR